MKNGLCPVTGGAATRMTRESFARICAGKRSARKTTGIWRKSDWFFNRCKTCKGRRQHWPPELEIIEIKTEDKAMAKKDKQAEAERAELERAAKRIEAEHERMEAEHERAELERAAAAWNALMERTRDAGFADIADGDPVVMAGTYIMAVNEIRAERDRLRKELAERDAAPAAETMTTEETARNVALLRWAREQLEAGRIGFSIEVREAAA